MVALRKNLTIERTELDIIDDIRFFFYISNDREASAEEIVFQSRDRATEARERELDFHGVAPLSPGGVEPGGRVPGSPRVHVAATLHAR